MNAYSDFYKGRRVLVTGDTGFKGAWLCQWLIQLGADVHGLGLEPETRPALYDVLQFEQRLSHSLLDVRDEQAVKTYIHALKPDVVFHLAAQALVRRSYREPVETLSTNVMGTAHLLEALRTAGYSPEHSCQCVVVTSDKCYENLETGHAYCEEDRVGGHDVYSMSKGAAELVVASWRRSFLGSEQNSGVRVASCRAGNVIGGGDWAEDRIVPDCIRSLTQSLPISVRNPNAVRPWQHVLEPLSGYLDVAHRMHADAGIGAAWNFGPGRDSERPVSALSDAVVAAWGEGSWSADVDCDAPHEANFLNLCIDKAARELRWHPVWDFDAAVGNTVKWYRKSYDTHLDFNALIAETERQIERYCADAQQRGVAWAGSAE